jgi:hypothetical protein
MTPAPANSPSIAPSDAQADVSQISNLKSQINEYNSQSAICNLKSEMNNPQSAIPRESWGDWLRRALLVPWPVAAVLFIAGMLAGVGGMKMMQRNQTLVVRVEQPAHPAGAAQVALAEPEPEMPAISAAQAEALRREMQASALRDRILRALDRRDYAAAARDYRQLWENYRGSAALRQLGENPLLRRAAEQFTNGGRI